MSNGKLNITEVSMLVGSSIQTISSWYKWRASNPDHPLAKKLPDYSRIGNKNTRYWQESDIGRLIEFKTSIPQGRNGIMGTVTQKYVKKGNKKHAENIG